MHGRGDKPSAARDLHVGIRVGHDGVPARINNFPIHARVMTALLVQDRERARAGQVAIASTRDGRRENWTAILEEIRPLFLQIDLNGGCRAQQHGCAEKYRDPENNPHIAFKPARRSKVARLYCDWGLDRWMWLVPGEFEIFEFEVVDVFNGRIQFQPG